MEGHIWRDAEVSYPDWHGTAQLEHRLTERSIEQAVGLDPSKWWVIGLDIGGGESAHDLHVIAVRRSLIPDGGDALPKIAGANGGVIPVTDFQIHDVDPYAVLQAITHQFELRLRLRGSRDLPIVVEALGDVPEQAQGSRSSD